MNVLPLRLAILHRSWFNYAVKCARNPDPGSDFERSTRFIRWLPDRLFLFVLLRILCYDGLIFATTEHFIGHVFFQRHWSEWNAFHIWVEEDQRGQKYAQKMLREFLDKAYEAGKGQVQIGNGGNDIVNHLWEKIISGDMRLAFDVSAGDHTGSVLFSRPRFFIRPT